MEKVVQVVVQLHERSLMKQLFFLLLVQCCPAWAVHPFVINALNELKAKHIQVVTAIAQAKENTPYVIPALWDAGAEILPAFDSLSLELAGTVTQEDLCGLLDTVGDPEVKHVLAANFRSTLRSWRNEKGTRLIQELELRYNLTADDKTEVDDYIAHYKVPNILDEPVPPVLSPLSSKRGSSHRDSLNEGSL